MSLSARHRCPDSPSMPRRCAHVCHPRLDMVRYEGTSPKEPEGGLAGHHSACAGGDVPGVPLRARTRLQLPALQPGGPTSLTTWRAHEAGYHRNFAQALHYFGTSTCSRGRSRRGAPTWCRGRMGSTGTLPKRSIISGPLLAAGAGLEGAHPPGVGGGWACRTARTTRSITSSNVLVQRVSDGAFKKKCQPCVIIGALSFFPTATTLCTKLQSLSR
jgi:hypothetical protein